MAYKLGTREQQMDLGQAIAGLGSGLASFGMSGASKKKKPKPTKPELEKSLQTEKGRRQYLGGTYRGGLK